ncbi:MAG: N-acyl homoserine lactonase family protein [Betaproteobacteria bacterium]|nr:MAG: N-acyl homoserine lactonase family protein [Betaproteobacteria bacterium]
MRALTYTLLRPLFCAVLAAVVAGCAQVSPAAKSGIERMYVFYCGETQVPDVSPWAPGTAPGTAMLFSDNCYLIKHAKGYMLWDSGLTDTLADKPDGMQGPRGMVMKRKQTLAAQLAAIGVAPGDVKYLAFSHTHSDHVGNANLFTAATLYIQQAEYDAAFGPEPAKFGFVPANYDKLRASPMVKLTGDHDIFGDGSVTIVSTPGHTPGHQSLLVRLPQTGAVVLSGDFVHFRANFDARRAPSFNFNQEQSLQSIDKVAALLKAERGQLWINHDSAQSATIPHAPQYVQ